MEARPRLPDETVNVSPRPMGVEALWLVGGIGAVVLALGGVLIGLLEWGVPRLPPNFEARLFGRAVGYSPSEPSATEERLSALTNRLASHWEGNPYTFRVSVIDAPEPNAMAMPGGRILVTQGLLDRVESENELASVLGHELGHFHGRDHLRGLGRSAGIALLSVGLGAVSADGAELFGLVSAVASRTFDRAQERAADRFGLEMVYREYGHVAGGWRFYERLADEEASRPLDRAAGFFGTHPYPGDRIADLEAFAWSEGWPIRGTLAPLPSEGDSPMREKVKIGKTQAPARAYEGMHAPHGS